MWRLFFGLLGWKGIAIAGLATLTAISGAFAYGYYEGRSGKAAAVEAAQLAIIVELKEQGYENAVEALSARRDAERDFDSGRLPDDDPHCRDC